VQLTALLKKLNELLTVEGVERILMSMGKMTRGSSLSDAGDASEHVAWLYHLSMGVDCRQGVVHL
jgi:hypothetical protein